MRRTATSVSLLIVLFASTLVAALDIRPVKAQDIIYIRADGSVDPPTTPISHHKDVYTFTDNISVEIVIEKGSIIVDGAGYTLQGAGVGNGFYWSGINEVTIKNTNIQDYGNGIYINSSSLNTVYGNDITNCEYAISLEWSGNNLAVSGNNITNCSEGVCFYFSSNNPFYQNNIENCDFGIDISQSSNNTVYGNNVTNCQYAISLGMSSDNVLSQNNIESGVLYGVSIYSSNKTVVSGNNITNCREGVYLTESSNSSCYRNNIRNCSDYGLEVYISSNNTISENNITSCSYGFSSGSSLSIVFRNNTMVDNQYSFGVVGYVLEHFIHDVDTSNTVDGKPVCYLINQKNLLIDPSTYPNIGYLALVNSTSITIRGLELNNNNVQGILLAGTTNSQIINNNIANSEVGVDIEASSSNNTISGNYLANDWGVELFFSSNNNVSGNTMTNGIGSVIVSYSSNNTVSGNNILNSSDTGVYLHTSSFNTFYRNNITANWHGFDLAYSSFNTIAENNVTNNHWGVYLYSSNDNIFSGNNIKYNSLGFDVAYSSNNTLSVNNVTNNLEAGVYLDSSTRNIISANNLSNNGGSGVKLYWSSNNIVSGNNVTSNSMGINLYSVPSNNRIYHNNFISNTIQVYNLGSSNAFDDGYPSGGNYWRDYAGSDANGDGIGDTARIFDANNKDRYPLMNPWPSHDVAVASLSASENFVVRGDSVVINASVADQGDFPENFILTVYANDTVIFTQGIGMPNRGLNAMAFSWNTTNYACGRYIIRAYVTIVSGETDVADNTRIDGTLIVTILGDVNGDGKIDNSDLSILSQAYGTIPPSPKWNPSCDLNGDGKIDVLDLYQLSRNYGEP